MATKRHKEAKKDLEDQYIFAEFSLSPLCSLWPIVFLRNLRNLWIHSVSVDTCSLSR